MKLPILVIFPSLPYYILMSLCTKIAQIQYSRNAAQSQMCAFKPSLQCSSSLSPFMLSCIVCLPKNYFVKNDIQKEVCLNPSILPPSRARSKPLHYNVQAMNSIANWINSTAKAIATRMGQMQRCQIQLHKPEYRTKAT